MREILHKEFAASAGAPGPSRSGMGGGIARLSGGLSISFSRRVSRRRWARGRSNVPSINISWRRWLRTLVEHRFPEGDQFLFVRSNGRSHRGRVHRPGRRLGRCGRDDIQGRRRANRAFGACFGDPRAAGQLGRISDAAGRIRGDGAETQRRRMDRSERPAWPERWRRPTSGAGRTGSPR